MAEIVPDAEARPPDPLPPPGLFSADIPNLGPVIDPPFVDVPDFRQYLTPADTRPVDYESLEPRTGDEGRRQAVDAALSSDRITGKLDGKRYEVLEVGTQALDRQTDYPLVIIYNYTDNVVVEATIDPVRRAVHEVREARYQPPLAASEQSQALELVRDDGRLSEAGIDVATGVGLIVEDVNFRSRRYEHRLVDLRFGPANRYLPTAFAIVDLSDREVVRTGLVAQEGSS
ncbi:hypothetical protein [Saccharothrix sp.]|uniref:hypothetical protein n=1 Tax=Saccharothrix sp. TaxID=1873460 RepID=UPI0028122988|nr:hypothetical protein [Saccharothrix sp.]